MNCTKHKYNIYYKPDFSHYELSSLPNATIDFSTFNDIQKVSKIFLGMAPKFF